MFLFGLGAVFDLIVVFGGYLFEDYTLFPFYVCFDCCIGVLLSFCCFYYLITCLVLNLI